jgi:hypothetical protein
VRRQWRGVDTDPGWINRKFKDLETQIRQLAAAKRLPASSVAGGVITIHEILTNPNAAVSFRNVDTMTVTALGDQPFLLAYRPMDGSEHITWHPQGGGGLHITAADWSRAGQLVTIPAFDGLALGDVFTCEYARFPGQTAAAPTITDPSSGESVADTTPTITGTGEPGFTVAVAVDGTTVGTVTVDVTGAWSVTVGSALSPGGHTITAAQTMNGSAAGSATSTFTTPAPTPPTPTLIGNTTPPGVWDSVAKTLTYALPAGTNTGDLIVLTVRGAVAPGGGELILDVDCTDARMTLAHKATSMNGPNTVVEAVFVGLEDGSGDPVVVDVTQNPSYSAAAAGVLATFDGVHGFGVISATESETTTPVVGGVAAVAVTWIRGSSFTTVNAAPPTGYTNVASTGASYSSTCISWWYDAGASSSPAGTFAGEGCCVIAIV